MNDLMAQLEAAREGSRELSDQVLLAVGWFVDTMTVQGCGVKEVEIWCCPDGAGAGSYETARRPNPTRNVQDAIDCVVPAKCSWEVRENKFTNEGHAWVYDPNDNELRTYGKSTVPALAFCIACLRAQENTATPSTKAKASSTR